MSADIDRFAPPDEPRQVATCAQCGGEIYVGDDVSRIDDGGGFVHNGHFSECAEEYAKDRVYDRSGAIDANGDVE